MGVDIFSSVLSAQQQAGHMFLVLLFAYLNHLPYITFVYLFIRSTTLDCHANLHFISHILCIFLIISEMIPVLVYNCSAIIMFACCYITITLTATGNPTFIV